MLGYELIHGFTAIELGLALVLFGTVGGVVLIGGYFMGQELLGEYFNTFDNNYTNNKTIKPAHKGGLLNNWGGNYKRYSQVWVGRYVMQSDGEYELVWKHEYYFNDDLKGFSWHWNNLKQQYAWIQDAPPAKPLVIMSKGFEKDVLAILGDENNNEIDQKEAIKA